MRAPYSIFVNQLSRINMSFNQHNGLATSLRVRAQTGRIASAFIVYFIFNNGALNSRRERTHERDKNTHRGIKSTSGELNGSIAGKKDRESEIDR